MLNILMVYNGELPPTTYGGTQRVVWSLIKGLAQLNHKVYLLTSEPIDSPWVTCIHRDKSKPLEAQIPSYIDVVHFQNSGKSDKPYVITRHGNSAATDKHDANTIFVSHKHALNHGGEAYVHNGLDWSDYQQPNLQIENRDNRYHFLGKAAWRIKNVQGAIDITKKSGTKLDVLGGSRLNLKMGFRLTLDMHVKFHGMVGNDLKCQVLQRSKGLIFPVTWEEPFGLAITESLYMGCPVYSTPYGSLPELITNEVGVLSNKEDELVEAVKHGNFSPRLCHEYAREYFDHLSMAKSYIEKYEQAIAQQPLNQFLSTPLEKKKGLTYIK
ncbi:glycosyltransferase [Vibrio hippocampi]|uniref:Glycosyl transferase n=1 Tax=Vibrio hippocampi TaxID=654686 RepID=A0ABM8ZKB4_9VIBR|nr:glycosyltransferase [Vibrio hippocampi]CAH0527253.1 hypothetical protein VHP8226_02581 [Vibrio hippocampi]